MLSQNNNLDIPQYDKMMGYISKNRKIPDGLQAIENNPSMHQEALALKQAILEGKDSQLFYNKNCFIYLMYLIKGDEKLNEAPLEETLAITALTYLMGIKSKNEFKIININEDDNFRRLYIDSMVEKAKLSGIELDAVLLEAEIKKLTGINAWVMSTNFTFNSNAEEEFVKVTFNASGPYLHFEESTDNYFVPSVGMMYLFAKQINPDFIKFYTILGRISELTLKNLHRLGFHPLQIHGGEFVRDNLESAHYLTITPFIMLLHDYYHAYSGSLLKKDEHLYLFNNFIPTLEQLKNNFKEKQKDDSKISTILKNFISQLNDMDLGVFFLNYSSILTEEESIFSLWIESIYMMAKKLHVSVDAHIFQEYPHLQDAVKFYFELYNTLDFDKDQFLIQLFSDLDIEIAAKMQDFVVINKDQFPVEFDTRAFKSFCDDQEEREIDVLLNLVNSCQSPEEFGRKIFSSEYSNLYLKLIKSDCIYLPDTVNLTDQNLQKMKNDLQHKKNSFKPKFNINLNARQGGGVFSKMMDKLKTETPSSSNTDSYKNPFKKQ